MWHPEAVGDIHAGCAPCKDVSATSLQPSDDVIGVQRSDVVPDVAQGSTHFSETAKGSTPFYLAV